MSPEKQAASSQTLVVGPGGTATNTTMTTTTNVLTVAFPGFLHPSVPVVLLGVVVLIATLIPMVAPETAKSLTALDVFQALVVVAIVLLAWLDQNRPVKLDGLRAERAVEQFRRYWAALWVIWVILYLLWSAKDVVAIVSHAAFFKEPDWLRAINTLANLLNNLQSTILCSLFWIMARPSFRQKGSDKSSIPLAVGVTMLAVATTVELLLVLLLPGGEDNGTRLGPADTAAIAFSTISGLYAATAMGLFLGRLESAFMLPSVTVLALLYVYAAIQPLFPLFRLAETHALLSEPVLHWIQYTLKAFALLFKVALYLFVRARLRTGRLMFFLDRVQKYYLGAQTDWETYEKETFQAPA